MEICSLRYCWHRLGTRSRGSHQRHEGQESRAWLGSATYWLEAEAGRDAGMLGQAGPARREQQLCLKGKLRLVLCKLETRIARVVYREKL